jgi:hypothetical protein
MSKSSQKFNLSENCGPTHNGLKIIKETTNHILLQKTEFVQYPVKSYGKLKRTYLIYKKFDNDVKPVITLTSKAKALSHLKVLTTPISTTNDISKNITVIDFISKRKLINHAAQSNEEILTKVFMDGPKNKKLAVKNNNLKVPIRKGFKASCLKEFFAFKCIKKIVNSLDNTILIIYNIRNLSKGVL